MQYAVPVSCSLWRYHNVACRFLWSHGVRLTVQQRSAFTSICHLSLSTDRRYFRVPVQYGLQMCTGRSNCIWDDHDYYYYYYYYYYLSPLFWVFTIIPETSPVSRVHSVAAVLWLQFMVKVILCRMVYIYVLYVYISTFRSIVQCPIWLFSVVPYFVLSRYVAQVLSDYEMVPIAPIITGITVVCYIPHAMNLYSKVLVC